MQSIGQPTGHSRSVPTLAPAIHERRRAKNRILWLRTQARQNAAHRRDACAAALCPGDDDTAQPPRFPLARSVVALGTVVDGRHDASMMTMPDSAANHFHQ